MHRMSLMAMIVPDQIDGQRCDRTRCAKIAMVHDLAESIVGDITPGDVRVTKQEKEKLERDAMTRICNETLQGSAQGQELLALWEEYEAASTVEARVVKDLDKFDMILQAWEYEQSDARPLELQPFFDSTKGRFTTDFVKPLVDMLNQKRQQSAAATATSSAGSAERQT
ncbi:hypothetical protein, variant [Capsaspora owczarzaki ATCC 30864]|nr:hypothetical protein, variant [Capsaspora owczarzaki ATCC 30864]